jgi:hypothetical protein
LLSRRLLSRISKSASGLGLIAAAVLVLGVAPAVASAAGYIQSESFSGVGSHAATLSAQLNLGSGEPVDYHFEYGTTNAYGTSTAPASTGSAVGSTTVASHLENLEPNTEYHFRIVVAAENGAGSEEGTDVAFRTLPAGGLGLPDGRVYEMVTPPENQNADVYIPRAFSIEGESEGVQTSRAVQTALDGDAIEYAGQPTAGGKEGAGGNGLGGQGEGNQYLATRASNGGWAQVNLDPPGYVSARYEAFSSDLSTGIINVGAYSGSAQLPPLTPEAPHEYPVLYTRSNSVGDYRPLFTRTPPNRPAVENNSGNQFQAFYAGQSSDGGQLLFEANDVLLEGGGKLATEVDNDVKEDLKEGVNRYYLYDSTGGPSALVSVLPDGTATGGSFGASPGPGAEAPDLDHIISATGERIFWTSSDGDLYVREDADSASATTIELDESRGAGASGGGKFWAASSDGSEVFFTDCSRLTENATAVAASCEGGDLYEETIDPTTGQLGALADLTVDHNAADPLGANVLGVIGASEDGEYVYFVATGDLAAGGISGEPNLYVWHAGATRFIATLSAADGLKEKIPPYSGCTICAYVGDWRSSLSERTAEVAPNGNAVVFMSNQSLIVGGYPGGAYPNGDLEEVYVYEAEGAGHLSCVSCNPSGEPPLVNFDGAAAYLPTAWNRTAPPRWISEDGSRVFFDSFEPLVPQDTNGKLDVYEWERDGSGSCTEGTGCIYLLSGGSGEGNSYLAGAGANGGDVFIITRAQLTPEDPNSEYNVFDARVDGVQPVSPPICQGSGCQGVPSAPPIFATPASQTFEGVGNFPVSQLPLEGPKAKHTIKKKHKKKVKGKAKKPKGRRVNPASHRGMKAMTDKAITAGGR